MGWRAGYQNVSGTNNVLLRLSAGYKTVIGTGAQCNAHNKIRLGNSSVSEIEGQVPFSSPSDRRLKKNIADCQAGLDFINRLRPVLYQWKKGQGDKVFTGFIAQEVDEAAQEVGFNFSAFGEASWW